MTESENTESRRERRYHHVKMATLKDWLLIMEHDEFIHMKMESADSPSNTTSANLSSEYFEFSKENFSATSSADELFFKGKLLPLDTVMKRRQNAATSTAAAMATVTAAIDRVRSMSSIEDSIIPRCIDNADRGNIISSPHSRRFSSSDINVSEYHLNESPADLTERSWSLRRKHHTTTTTKQNKQSWMVEKLKASRTFIKSLFSNSASSEKDKSCSCPAPQEDDTNVGSSAGNKNKQPAAKDLYGVENGDADAMANTISKSLHDLGSNSSGRRSSFSGVLKRHLSSKGSNVMMASAMELKRSVSDEKSVEAAIAHCKLSMQKASHSQQLNVAPKFAASGNHDVATPPNTQR